jgi:hypothetical protein
LWQNRVLTEDEQLSPTFEDLILANLLFLIDVRLPGCVRDHYQHLIDKTKSLMDYKDEILSRTPEFFREIEGKLCTISTKDVDRIERYLYFCCSTRHRASKPVTVSHDLEWLEVCLPEQVSILTRNTLNPLTCFSFNLIALYLLKIQALLYVTCKILP